MKDNLIYYLVYGGFLIMLVGIIFNIIFPFIAGIVIILGSVVYDELSVDNSKKNDREYEE